MDKLFIGITGKANAGKDTIASMINYFYCCTLTYSTTNFNNWQRNKIIYGYENNLHSTNSVVVHFADNLKYILSVMYGIDLHYFYDRKYKDHCFYDLLNNKFINSEMYMSDKRYIEFRIEELTDDIKNINDFINTYRFKNQIPVIRLRTLLQYFGTEICRHNLNEDIWTNSCINNCINDRNSDIAIIADIRFPSEWYAITNQNNNFMIKVIRPNNSVEFEHESEKYDIMANTTIYNDGTLEDLYNSIEYLYNQVIIPKISKLT